MLRLRPDWYSYLHALRAREIEAIFQSCPSQCFTRGLELGAGDGFQSKLLAQYAAALVVTDYSPDFLSHPDTETIAYRVCDAERVGEVFASGEFDLIYSSNMLEHLPDVSVALAGMHKILRDDGIAIHVMPSPFWKLCQMAGFYPNFVISRIERYFLRQFPPSADPSRTWNNNPKVESRRYGYLRRLLWPIPHGAATSNLEEFRTFREGYWRARFAEAGFTVARVIRGPISSGYGFGLDAARASLERLGLASEYAYVVVKRGCSSPYLRYFA